MLGIRQFPFLVVLSLTTFNPWFTRNVFAVQGGSSFQQTVRADDGTAWNLVLHNNYDNLIGAGAVLPASVTRSSATGRPRFYFKGSIAGIQDSWTRVTGSLNSNQQYDIHSAIIVTKGSNQAGEVHTMNQLEFSHPNGRKMTAFASSSSSSSASMNSTLVSRSDLTTFNPLSQRSTSSASDTNAQQQKTQPRPYCKVLKDTASASSSESSSAAEAVSVVTKTVHNHQDPRYSNLGLSFSSSGTSRRNAQAASSQSTSSNSPGSGSNNYKVGATPFSGAATPGKSPECYVALFLHGSYVDFHGGSSDNAIFHAMSTFNHVQGIYEREAGILLKLIYLHSYENAMDASGLGNRTESSLQNVLDLMEKAKKDHTRSNSAKPFGPGYDSIKHKVCIHHTLSNIHDSGLLGLAYEKQVCVNQGKNLGVSTLNNMGKPLEHALYSIVVGHEIGHNLGASHDVPAASSPSAPPSSSSSGTCDPPNDKFIMAPYLPSGKNAVKFSSCSASTITGNLNSKSNCVLSSERDICHQLPGGQGGQFDRCSVDTSFVEKSIPAAGNPCNVICKVKGRNDCTLFTNPSGHTLSQSSCSVV